MKTTTLHHIYTFSLRLFDRLLYLYPADFRRRFGSEMTQVYQDLLSEPRHCGSLSGVIELWLKTLPDLIWNAAQENLHQWRKTMNRSAHFWSASGMVLLLAWMILVGWSLLKSLAELSVPDLTWLVLGDSFSSLAYTALEIFTLFAPLAALLAFLLPQMRVHFNTSEGVLAQITVQRSGRFNLFLIAVSAALSITWLGLLLAARWSY